MPGRALRPSSWELLSCSWLEDLKPPNARKGITTAHDQAGRVVDSLNLKPPNARKGITTVAIELNPKPGSVDLKPPNARKGITTVLQD